MSFLKIENLNAYYGAAQVLWGVSIDIERNEIVSLIGANGAGKTTLMRTITGLTEKRNGEITYCDQSIIYKNSGAIVSMGIAHVPEGRRLFSGMSVEDNLIMGAYVRKDRDEVTRDLDRVYNFFPRLAQRKKQIAGAMSGGEQQMCAIGRAMMSAPKLLLIDELSLGLAPVFIEELLEIIKLLGRQGTTIFLVEQDVQVGLDISDRAYVLEYGKVVMQGASVELQNNPKIKESYLGI